MLFKLFLLFVLVPLAELAILLIIAQETHWLISIGIVLFTGFLGAYLAKGQGIAALTRVRSAMTDHVAPTDAILDAALILFAGGMLLAPGILTDIFGMSLLIPQCRSFYKPRLIAWFKKRFKVETVVQSMAGASPLNREDDDVIDSYVVPTPKTDATDSATADTTPQSET